MLCNSACPKKEHHALQLSNVQPQKWQKVFLIEMCEVSNLLTPALRRRQKSCMAGLYSLLFMKTEVHYHVHSSLPLDPILSQLNQAQTFKPWAIILILTLSKHPNPVYKLYLEFMFLFPYVTCPNHLFLTHLITLIKYTLIFVIM
jgi:hypothetical protein